MLDLKWIRENPDDLDQALARRGSEPLSGEILGLDQQRRKVQTGLQEMQNRRNAASKAIGEAKRKGEDAASAIQEVANLKSRMSAEEAEERVLAEKLDGVLSGIPNVLLDDVPDGTDESDNVELRAVGNRRNFEFAPKQHFELGEALGCMTTIIDSNLTTLIAAVLLFQFGSGPIKGFAVTLAIGLITSMTPK